MFRLFDVTDVGLFGVLSGLFEDLDEVLFLCVGGFVLGWVLFYGDVFVVIDFDWILYGCF